MKPTLIMLKIVEYRYRLALDLAMRPGTPDVIAVKAARLRKLAAYLTLRLVRQEAWR